MGRGRGTFTDMDEDTDLDIDMAAGLSREYPWNAREVLGMLHYIPVSGTFLRKFQCNKRFSIV